MNNLILLDKCNYFEKYYYEYINCTDYYKYLIQIW